MNHGPRWKKHIAEIERLYQAGESAETLAARYDTTALNMYKTMQRYGIQTRTPKQAAAMRESMGRGKCRARQTRHG
jgi:hypothetical protein